MKQEEMKQPLVTILRRDRLRSTETLEERARNYISSILVPDLTKMAKQGYETSDLIISPTPEDLDNKFYGASYGLFSAESYNIRSRYGEEVCDMSASNYRLFFKKVCELLNSPEFGVYAIMKYDDVLYISWE